MIVREKATPLQNYGFTKASGVMREMITQAANDPALIRQAIGVIRAVDGGSYVDEAKAICEFVRDHIRYTNDVSGEDIYREPLLTLDLKAGDCNNKVVLGAALAKAVGFPTRMVFVFQQKPGFGNDFPFHVYFQIDVTKNEGANPNWVSCETIPVPSGRPGRIGPDRLLEFGDNCTIGFPEFVEVDQ